ncbi:MAG: helix-turn-helix domain-containing protein [Actinomycetota bacterium]|nr:helix-turn-helix domain-containing protein [Actinomycetota bacterium]
MDTSEVVKEFRGRHGLSQTTLSRLTGIPQPVLSMYEHGRRSPSIETLERILSVGSETVEVVPKPSRQDDRSVSKTIEIHRIVLEKFLDDPDRVLKLGRDRLRVLDQSLSKRSSPYIETWQCLLDGPRSEIVRLFLSTDEDDIELLKMSPFTTLLNDEERDEVTRRSKLRRAGTR